jgi:ABC-type branched-subunit amino acid transport system ATPase component
MSFLEIDGVSLRFAGLLAVDQVSLRIDEGEMVGLIGPNGSGKTTLLNVLTGHYAPDSGSVRLAGRSIHGLRPNQITRLGIARMFQLTRLFRRLSTLDNLITAGCAVGLGYDAAQARADALIEGLGLGEVRDEDGAHLSGGQQKLLEFGCMFMGAPRLAVLDEPFAAIHPTMREIMVRIIKDRHAQGQTFLIVSHDLPAVIDLGPRLIVMNAGSVIAEGAPESVLTDREVIEAYLGGAAA